LELLSRPSEPSYSIHVLGDPAKLLEKIKSAGYEVEEAHLGSYTIRGLDAEHAEDLWRWAAECETGLQTLAPARNSLEKIFVDAVRENAQNRGASSADS